MAQKLFLFSTSSYWFYDFVVPIYSQISISQWDIAIKIESYKIYGRPSDISASHFIWRQYMFQSF